MILITKLLLKDGKMLFFVFLGKGVYMAKVDQVDQIDQNTKTADLWSINNKIWSTFFIKIDHTISFLICALQALVNLVNFFRYTPPHERKTGEFVVNFSIFASKKLTTKLTTNEESTTYRGCFLVLFPKMPKSFILNTVL